MSSEATPVKGENLSGEEKCGGSFLETTEAGGSTPKRNFAAQVNELTFTELREKLQGLGLGCSGTKKDLKKKLKDHLERKAASQSESEDRGGADGGRAGAEEGKWMRPKIQRKKDGQQKQPYDYYLVIDFEATCQENNNNFTHEIIEFPVVCMNSTTLAVEHEFHRYVKPVKNPVLSDFCKNLTGITQEHVDSGVDFVTCLGELRTWMADKKLGTAHTYAFLTDGPYDFERFLAGQCKVSGIAYPSLFRHWVDIRRTFRRCLKKRPHNLLLMLSEFGLTFEGRQHSGLDDSRNIARVAAELIRRGYVVMTNSRIDRG